MKSKKMLSAILTLALCFSSFAFFQVSANQHTGKIAAAVADAENWSFGNLTQETALADGKVTFTNDGTPDMNRYALYRGDFLSPGETAELTFRAENKTGGWTALMFRVNNAHSAVPSLWDPDAGYSLWLSKGEAAIAIGTTKKQTLEVDLFDGNVHTIKVAVTDETDGINVKFMFDGDKVLEWKDNEKLFPSTEQAKRTAFCIQDAYGDTDAINTLTVGDIPPVPDTEGKLAAAVQDTERWLFNNADEEALADGAITFENDGKATDGSKNENVNLAYNGDLVRSGRTMDFDFQAKDQNGWTALFFRTKTNMTAVPSIWDANVGYRLWFYNGETQLLVTSSNEPPVATAKVNMMDGRLHRIQVTITDTAEGVKITCVFDGDEAQKLEYVDTANTYPAENTGFAIHDFYGGATNNTIRLSDHQETEEEPEADPFLRAFDDASLWKLTRTRYADKTITGKVSGSGAMRALYVDDCIGTQGSFSFKLTLGGPATDNWASVMFLQPNALSEGVEYWAMKSGYALHIDQGTKTMTLRKGAQAEGDKPILDSYTYTDETGPYNGKDNRYIVKIAEQDNGLKITVSYNGKEILSAVDEGAAVTKGNTAFSYHQFSAASGISSFTLAAFDPATESATPGGDDAEEGGSSTQTGHTGMPIIAVVLLAGAMTTSVLCVRMRKRIH